MQFQRGCFVIFMLLFRSSVFILACFLSSLLLLLLFLLFFGGKVLRHSLLWLFVSIVFCLVHLSAFALVILSAVVWVISSFLFVYFICVIYG